MPSNPDPAVELAEKICSAVERIQNFATRRVEAAEMIREAMEPYVEAAAHMEAITKAVNLRHAALREKARALKDACKFDGVPIVVRSTRLHTGYAELPLEVYDAIRDALQALAEQLGGEE